jgi:hypothetical protein
MCGKVTESASGQDERLRKPGAKLKQVGRIMFKKLRCKTASFDIWLGILYQPSERGASLSVSDVDSYIISIESQCSLLNTFIVFIRQWEIQTYVQRALLS